MKLLLCVFILLIQAFGTKGTCSLCSFPSVCSSQKCCPADRMIGSCLKDMNTDFKAVYSANHRLTDLYRFNKKPITNDVTNEETATSLSLIDNGIQGKALKGDGATKIRLHDANSCIFTNTSKLTFSFWVKYGNISGDSQVFFTVGADQTTPSGARLQISQPNTTKEEIGILINTHQFRYFAVIPCPWNIWSHLVVTMDLETASSTIIYRNGKVVDEGIYHICFGCNSTHSQMMYFGDYQTSTAPNATIDEAALFCTELNSTAVADMYEFYKGPTGYYLLFKKTFSSADKIGQISDKIKSMVAGVTVNDIASICSTPGGLDCTISTYVSNNDGEAINDLVLFLHPPTDHISMTVVPKKKIFLDGSSQHPNELKVNWRIDDDLPYSIYQYYNISCAPISSPSSAVYVGYERYHLDAKFTYLQPFTEYVVTLKQYFLGGAYRQSTINVTTAERAPDPPLGVIAISMNTSCVRLQWKNPQEPIGGLIRGFKINYSPSTDSSQKEELEMTTTHQPFYVKDICGLQHGTKYKFNVTAKTIAYGKNADTVEKSTLGYAPDVPPSNVVSHNGTSPPNDTSTCKLSWDIVADVVNKYNVTAYHLMYIKEGSNKSQFAQRQACNPTKILSGLDFYSKYVVQISAANQNGIGPYSAPVYCFTKGLVPSAPPSNAKAVGKTSTSCLVSWNEVPKQFQNNLILGYNISYILYPTQDTNYVVVPGQFTNMKEITGLKKFSKYNVTLTSYTDKGMGNDSAVAHLTCETLQDVPDASPTNLQQVSKTNQSCEISWDEIQAEFANGIILGYEITGIDTNNTDSNTNRLGIQMTCDKNITITGLQPFRMYNITVSAFNGAGVSNRSEVFSCITEQGVPLQAPPNLRCTPQTSRTLEVCWDEVPILQRQGIVNEYTVEYQSLNISSSSLNFETSNTLCVNVTGLEEFSMYSLKVRAITLYPGNYSDTALNCMTKEGLPTTSPVGLTGNNITAYSLRITWGDLQSQPPGILRSFVVYWRIANASEQTTNNVTVPLSPRVLVIENLKLFTLYCVQVAGYTVGAGPKSECANISTDDKWLPPPDGIPKELYQMTNSTTKNCSIKWSKSNNSNPDPDGRVIGYSIFYRFFGTNDTWKEVKVEGENTTRHVLTDLEEFTKYEIRVAGYNIYGVGNKSITLLCYTKEAAPSFFPPNVTGTNASSTEILLNWDEIPKYDQNGIVRVYTVVIFEKALGNSSAVSVNYTVKDTNPSQRRRRAISIDPKTKVITGLKKFTTYGIQVYGVTVAAGPLSPVIYVTTAEDVPTSPVTNFTAVNSSSESLFLTWSNVTSENIHGIVRYFVIFYWKDDWPIIDMNNVTVPIDDVRVRTSVASARRRRRSVPVTVPSTAEFKFNLTGLEIWTNYTVQVAAYTVGVGAKSNEITVSTDEDKPCLPPSDIVFDVPIYAALQINWGKVKRECRNGIIRGYRLTYQKLSLGSLPVTVNLRTDQFSYTIENMDMEVNYTVGVLAYTSKGDGNISFDLARPAKMGPKHSPINVTAENFTTPTSIPLSWKPIKEPSIEEKLLGYKIKWKVLSQGEEEVEEAPWQEKTVRKESLTHVITNLKNFDRYQIEVFGFTRGGYGPSGITAGETCRCFRRITTNYRDFAPYNSVKISPDLKEVNMSGMIPKILESLILECCQSCKSHGKSFVDFKRNGQNKTALQSNEMDVVSLIDDSNDLSFPIFGWGWQDTYQEIYRFIPLVQSPGFAFILLEPKTDSPLRQIVFSIIETWPYLLITCIMALVAGIIMWFLDTSYNEEDFPHTYFKGIVCGWWWAFISMTTLGYGDKVPKADRSKAFAVIWVLTGLVVYGILSGSICTAFTTVIFQANTKLYGSEVAAIYDTPEYRFGVRRNAKVNTKGNYSTFDEILQALLNYEVTGILMDVNEAGTKAKEFKERGGGLIRIHQIFDYSSTFGIVIAGPSKKLYQCSKQWMSANRALMSSHIAKYMTVIEAEEVNEMVEIATGLFDAESQVFKDFLFYSLLAMGGFVVLGIIYEIVRFIQNKKKNKLETLSEALTFKQKVVKELDSFTRTFIDHLQEKVASLQEKHQKELKTYYKNNKDQFKRRQNGKLLALDDLLRKSSIKI